MVLAMLMYWQLFALQRQALNESDAQNPAQRFLGLQAATRPRIHPASHIALY